MTFVGQFLSDKIISDCEDPAVLHVRLSDKKGKGGNGNLF